MDARKRVALNLRRLRLQRELSQEKLATDAAVDTSYISQIETERYNPTVGILDKLAGALGVDVVELVAVPPAGSETPAPLRRRGGSVSGS